MDINTNSDYINFIRGTNRLDHFKQVNIDDEPLSEDSFRFALIDIIQGKQALRVKQTGANNVTKYGYIDLYPGYVYETNDPKLIKALKTNTIEKPFYEATKNVLEENEILYEIKVCKPCGGKRQTIVFNPVKEIEINKKGVKNDEPKKSTRSAKKQKQK